MAGLALSISWNALVHSLAREMLFEIKALGFEEIELSFNLTPEMLQDIETHLGESGIKVVSVHNYCPIPDGLKREEALPDCYAISSLDEEERARALRYSKRSIDTASRLGARAVVLHCGKVDVRDRTRDLIRLYEEGKKGTKEYNDLKVEALAERQSRVKGFLDNTLKSLDELNDHAREKNVCLGVETRFYSREIPDPEELRALLDRFKGSQIYYWHDTGHAEVMERLGFYRHKDILDQCGKRLLGVHLHGVLKCEDHMAPSEGDLDFTWIKPYLKKETIKVIEAHQPATFQDIKKSKELLERVLNEH